jgi:hypothetical protein
VTIRTPALLFDPAAPRLRAELLAWLPIAIGLAVLYVPSLYDLFTGIWSTLCWVCPSGCCTATGPT